MSEEKITLEDIENGLKRLMSDEYYEQQQAFENGYKYAFTWFGRYFNYLEQKIDKAIEYIVETGNYNLNGKELLKILKGDK